MSKKIIKRSLALGALMAFVITGSVYAGVYDINTPDQAFAVEDSGIFPYGSIIAKEVTINNSTGATINAYNDVTVEAKDGDVNLHGKGYAIQTGTTQPGDNAKPDLKIKISGYNIDLSRSAYGWVTKMEVGSTELIAENDVVVNGTHGLSNNSHKGIASVTAGGSIKVNATTGGAVSNNGSGWNITANDSIELIAPEGQNAIYSNNGTVTVKATNNTVIEGNIKTGNSGSVNVGFNGSQSYLTGSVIGDGTTELAFNEGATWNVSGESNVSALISDKGKIVFADGSHVHIDAGSGDLDITKKDLTAESINGLSKEEVVEKFNTVAQQLGVKEAVKDPEKGIKATVVVAEGDVTGEVTGEVVYSETAEHEYYHGTVTEVTEKVNTKNQAISDAGISLKLHWRAHVNDMNKRMGELRNAEGEHGVWARMVRGESEYKNTKAQYNQYQLGYDEKLSVDKRWTVGAAVTFAEGDANYGQGSTDDKSTAFAIYGSKLNNDGTFVDLIARYAHLESDLDDVNSGKGDYSTNGMSVSAEFGKRIQQGKGLWVEPQVELTYGTIDSAEFKFDGGKTVQVGDMDSLIGRVGFRIGKDLEQGNVYARASYLYDFEGETENAFSNATDSRTIAEDLGGGWWEVGVGANINLSDATYIYADVEKTFGGEVDTNWQWNLGVRYSF